MMAYSYIEYPNHEKLAEGEMLVTDPTKGLWQIVPNVERPYNLVYVPSINNVMAIRSLDELGDVEFQHIKVVK